MEEGGSYGGYQREQKDTAYEPGTTLQELCLTCLSSKLCSKRWRRRTFSTTNGSICLRLMVLNFFLILLRIDLPILR